RHGETESGSSYAGQLDINLTETGWQQMQQATGSHHYAHIISSPLQRCAGFATYLGKQLGCQVDIEPHLMEMHFGEWQGLSSDALMQRYPAELKSFWQDPLHCAPPGGETLADFNLRVSQARSHCEQRQYPSPTLLVAHGGVIRVLLCQWLGIPLQQLMRLHVPFASLSRVQLDYADNEVYPMLRFLNERSDE
ncbi:Alpha-ribazole-5'-phosphate phosphatase, partial [hydrothermal vent metagenome]